MEIEFTVQIDPIKKRHECHGAIALVLAYTLALFLAGLLCPHLWCWLLGLWFVISHACITRYWSMRAQQALPDTFRIQDDALIYCSKGKPCFSFPLSSICRIEYEDGIKIFTKQRPRLTLLSHQFSLVRFLAQTKKKQCDLFFPWFDESVKIRLEDIVHTYKSYHTSSF